MLHGLISLVNMLGNYKKEYGSEMVAKEPVKEILLKFSLTAFFVMVTTESQSVESVDNFKF
jgi:hypothetical protein